MFKRRMMLAVTPQYDLDRSQFAGSRTYLPMLPTDPRLRGHLRTQLSMNAT
jgi:hypothetical protein